MSDIKITIRTTQKIRVWGLFLQVSLQIGVIGVGVITDSNAMQWAGFLLLCLLLFGAVFINLSKDEGLSVSEARARIDEIEARQK